MARGAIDPRRARVLVTATAHLPEDAARRVTDRVLGAAPSLTTGQLGARLRRLCIDTDPDDAEARYETMIEQRRVVTYPTPEGASNLVGLHLPPTAPPPPWTASTASPGL